MDRELYNELRPEKAKSQESEGIKTKSYIIKAHRSEFLDTQMGQEKYLGSNF